MIVEFIETKTAKNFRYTKKKTALEWRIGIRKPFFLKNMMFFQGFSLILQTKSNENKLTY